MRSNDVSNSRATILNAVLSSLVVVLLASCGLPHAGRVATVPAPAAPLAVVLTTDCGVDMDDQWALTHIVLSPELDLREIVTTHASSIHFSSATSARTAAEVLSRVAPRKSASVPVVAGADAPLQDVSTPRENAGANVLLSLSREFSESRRLVVLSIGAATDVASAILKDPSFAERVAVVAMGFRDWPQGGDEFNIKNDPVAWQVLLNSRVPLVVGSAEAAKRSLRLNRAEAARVMSAHGSTGEYLYGLFDEWLTRNSELVAHVVAPGTWVVWDEVVVAYILGLARGEAVARPRLQPDLFFAHPSTRERITWITRIDSDRLWQDLTRKIDDRDRSTAARPH
jgi:inosine-uridine nucleoside N-ribohydrolase